MPASPRTPIRQAEVHLPVSDMSVALPYFTEMLGFSLDQIFPADDPAVAVLSGHGLRIRLDRDAALSPGRLRLLVDDPSAFAGGRLMLTAPNGTEIEIAAATPPLILPPVEHRLAVHRVGQPDSWGVGRAGMMYQDLIPGRLGGSVIASHIRIPKGGPVPDSEHYHTLVFQLIYCYRGWVRVVYEGQGPPFVLEPGDCVLQAPEIRHRVLESSDNMEVIELAVPAQHLTTLDHKMTLPNDPIPPEREFHGTRFVHHRRANAGWAPWRLEGYTCRDTGIGAASGGIGGVKVARMAPMDGPASVAGAPAVDAGGARWVHDADLLFNFILFGSVRLLAGNEDPMQLGAGDSFVIPPGMPAAFVAPTGDLEILEVSMPAIFATAQSGNQRAPAS